MTRPRQREQHRADTVPSSRGLVSNPSVPAMSHCDVPERTIRYDLTLQATHPPTVLTDRYVYRDAGVGCFLTQVGTEGIQNDHDKVSHCDYRFVNNGATGSPNQPALSSATFNKRVGHQSSC
jgi:hypothetical protein